MNHVLLVDSCSLHFDSPPLHQRETYLFPPQPPCSIFSPLSFATWRVCGPPIHSRFAASSFLLFHTRGSHTGHLHQLPMLFTNKPRPLTPCIYVASSIDLPTPVSSITSYHRHRFLIHTSFPCELVSILFRSGCAYSPPVFAFSFYSYILFTLQTFMHTSWSAFFISSIPSIPVLMCTFLRGP